MVLSSLGAVSSLVSSICYTLHIITYTYSSCQVFFTSLHIHTVHVRYSSYHYIYIQIMSGTLHIITYIHTVHVRYSSHHYIYIQFMSGTLHIITYTYSSLSGTLHIITYTYSSCQVLFISLHIHIVHVKYSSYHCIYI